MVYKVVNGSVFYIFSKVILKLYRERRTVLPKPEVKENDLFGDVKTAVQRNGAIRAYGILAAARGSVAVTSIMFIC